ncbi:GH116 family glycosyl hydrolase [Limibacter armeniacum]|uniref:GH116 family glycosyl hydrolase n=1 Tax=Limibacter armeniacum TaxID=466084 RepID=UPI002FE69B5B
MIHQFIYRGSLLTFVMLLAFAVSSFAQQQKQPVKETYTAKDRVRSGVALGGIGTGSIELRKDGNFHNWSIFNNYPLGAGPIIDLPQRPMSADHNSFLYFVVRYQLEGEQPRIKLLQLNDASVEGGLLNEAPIYYFPWLSNVESIEYAGRFPYVNMKFTDSEMPFDIHLKAQSPFIPHDVDNSSLPAIYFDFDIVSKSDKPVEVEVIGTLRNLVAYDVGEKYFTAHIEEKEGYKYFVQGAGGVDTDHISYGNTALGALGGEEVSYYLGWAHRHPYYEKMLVNSQLGNINDVENRNTTTPEGKKIVWMSKDDNNQLCKSSIAVTKTVEPGVKATANFFMNWYFPNAYGAVLYKAKKNNTLLENEKGYVVRFKPTEKVGHYYENLFESVDEVVDYIVTQRAELTRKTNAFVADFYKTDEEQYILDQVNSHLNTFVTSSQFDKSGRFGIREGMTSNESWGPNITTDVSLYGSVPIIQLFPDLHKASMKAHRALQSAHGEINHGIGYDLGKTQNGTFGVYERVDLAPNYIQLVLRDYLFTNDTAYLKEMWPSVQLAIDYVLKDKDKDGDLVPDMHGIMCSYDNFPMYGLSSYILTQWVTAMEMAAIAAEDMGEKTAARRYRNIAKKGVKLMNKELWNGEYFRLSNDYKGKKGEDEGCLTDQLFGQWVAHTVGIGRLYDKDKIHSSMESILKLSFIEKDYLRNCTWPEHPLFYPLHETDLWVDQANTPWTGVELAFASFLIYEGKVKEGKQVIKAVDDRYRKAGLYWDHQEFGGHYFRPMSSWAILNALSGFTLVKDGYTFSPKTEEDSFTYFFSANTGTGHFEKDEKGISVIAQSGALRILSLTLPEQLWQDRMQPVLKNGEEAIKVKKWEHHMEEGAWTAVFDKAVILKKGEVLLINSEKLSTSKVDQ